MYSSLVAKRDSLHTEHTNNVEVTSNLPSFVITATLVGPQLNLTEPEEKQELQQEGS